jgi:hypothetical protein
MRDRTGRGALGCIATIVVVLFAALVLVRVLPPYMHYLQFRDEMRADARFAVTLPDSVILVKLHAMADTLGLPAEAKHITIRRHPGRTETITIGSQYTEHVNLPIFGIKPWHFNVSVEETL